MKHNLQLILISLSDQRLRFLGMNISSESTIVFGYVVSQIEPNWRDIKSVSLVETYVVLNPAIWEFVSQGDALLLLLATRRNNCRMTKKNRQIIIIIITINVDFILYQIVKNNSIFEDFILYQTARNNSIINGDVIKRFYCCLLKTAICHKEGI